MFMTARCVCRGGPGAGFVLFPKSVPVCAGRMRSPELPYLAGGVSLCRRGCAAVRDVVGAERSAFVPEFPDDARAIVGRSSGR